MTRRLEPWSEVQQRLGYPGFHRRQHAPEVTVPWSPEAFAWLAARQRNVRFYVSRMTAAGRHGQLQPISLHTDDYEFADRFQTQFGGGA